MGDFVPDGSQFKEIVLAYKSHFDIGFTYPAPEIGEIYRTNCRRLSKSGLNCLSKSGQSFLILKAA